MPSRRASSNAAAWKKSSARSTSAPSRVGSEADSGHQFGLGVEIGALAQHVGDLGGLVPRHLATAHRPVEATGVGQLGTDEQRAHQLLEAGLYVERIEHAFEASGMV